MGAECKMWFLCAVIVCGQRAKTAFGSSTRGILMHMPCACVTLSAASLQAVAEGLRSADGIEAATRCLGAAAGWGGAAATTEALATLAWDLGFTMGGEADTGALNAA